TVCAPASGATFAVGATTVTCTASDAASPANTGTCSFTVTVVDNQPPGANCPANITQNTDANACSAVVTYSIPAPTDNCPGATTVCVPASGATFAVGATTVTCTASDAASPANTGTCSFTVTVVDNQPPADNCPAKITQNPDANACSAVVTYSIPAPTDNCPGATTVCVPASGATFAVGAAARRVRAEDAARPANTGTSSFTVTVEDNQPPTANCPANITR